MKIALPSSYTSVLPTSIPPIDELLFAVVDSPTKDKEAYGLDFPLHSGEILPSFSARNETWAFNIWVWRTKDVPILLKGAKSKERDYCVPMRCGSGD